MSFSAARQLRASLLFLTFALGCGSLKQASPDEASSSDTALPAPAGSPSQPDGGEPAPEARIVRPGGYCCSSDADCRSHACVEVEGQKICLDRCRATVTCENAATNGAGFTCDWDRVTDYGSCRPPPGFTCVPPERFVPGTRKDGDCCAARGNGEAGSECAGGLCQGLGDGPYFCTRFCTSTKDCPSSMICNALSTCEPATDTYECR